MRDGEGVRRRRAVRAVAVGYVTALGGREGEAVFERMIAGELVERGHEVESMVVQREVRRWAEFRSGYGTKTPSVEIRGVLEQAGP